ncbi:MAG: RNA polymerase sigma factor [Patescibacteria group bacterium]
MTDKDDEKLVDAAKADASKFGLLYEKYVKRVYQYFWYRVGKSKGIAEELAQETFMKAFRAFPTFTKRSASYFTYLIRIAHNTLVNYYRSKKPISLEEYGDIPVDTQPAMEHTIEARAILHGAESLTEEQRAALVMHYEEKYSTRDIAKKLGKTENAVKLLISRGRTRLKEEFAEDKNDTFFS